MAEHSNLSILEPQPDLFGAEPVPMLAPDPSVVRARLHLIMTEARAAQTLRGPHASSLFTALSFRR